MRKTTAHDDCQLISLCEMSRKSSSAKLTRQLQLYDVNVSCRTTKRSLVEQKYLAYTPTVKPFLNNAMKKKCIERTLKYCDWTAEDWSRSAFWTSRRSKPCWKECSLFVDVALNVIYRPVQFQK